MLGGRRWGEEPEVQDVKAQLKVTGHLLFTLGVVIAVFQPCLI